MLEGLARRGKTDPLGALGFIAPRLRTLFVHAFQSMVWNQLANERLELGTAPIVGDLVLARVEDADAGVCCAHGCVSQCGGVTRCGRASRCTVDAVPAEADEDAGDGAPHTAEEEKEEGTAEPAAKKPRRSDGNKLDSHGLVRHSTSCLVSSSAG